MPHSVLSRPARAGRSLPSGSSAAMTVTTFPLGRFSSRSRAVCFSGGMPHGLLDRRRAGASRLQLAATVAGRRAVPGCSREKTCHSRVLRLRSVIGGTQVIG